MENYLEDEEDTTPVVETTAPAKRQRKTVTLHMGKMRAKIADEGELISSNVEMVQWLTSHRSFLEEGEVDKAAYSVLHHMLRDIRDTFGSGKAFYDWYKQVEPRVENGDDWERIVWNAPEEPETSDDE